MSHNQLKINTKSPNIDGDITVNLSDIITVNSPANGEFLQKATSDWKTNTLTLGANGLLNNLVDYHSAGSHTFDLQDCYTARKVDGEFNVVDQLSLINSTGNTYIPNSNNKWTMGFEMPASAFPSGATVLFRAVVAPRRASGTYLRVQWHIGVTTSLANSTPIGNIAYSTPDFGATAFGLYVSDGTTKQIAIRITDISGEHTIPGLTGVAVQQITAKQLA